MLVSHIQDVSFVFCGYLKRRKRGSLLGGLKNRPCALALPIIIVSITKFSIMIGSPRAFLSRNRAQSRGCPITVIQFELFVIG